MAQIILPAAFLSALVAGAAAMSDRPSENARYSEPTSLAFLEEVPTASDWIFSNKQDDGICLLRKTHRVSKSTATVEADATCSEVFPDIDLVSVWQQDEEGNVTLADETGNAIAEFSWDQQTGFTSISGEPGKYALTPNS